MFVELPVIGLGFFFFFFLSCLTLWQSSLIMLYYPMLSVTTRSHGAARVHALNAYLLSSLAWEEHQIAVYFTLITTFPFICDIYLSATRLRKKKEMYFFETHEALNKRMETHARARWGRSDREWAGCPRQASWRGPSCCIFDSTIVDFCINLVQIHIKTRS